MMQKFRRLRPSGLIQEAKRSFAFSTPVFSLPDNEQPMYLVRPKNGFLPRKDPIFHLPPRFDVLEDILKNMTIEQPNGKKGLLYSGDLGRTVEKDLPLIDVSDIKDPMLVGALFRDYSFLLSAYILEPCDINWRKSNEYGLGRDRVPKSVAIPISILAAKQGSRPFMEYSYSYAPNNYKKIDPQEECIFDNMRAVRMFAGNEDENGFMMVHVAMGNYSGRLVKHVEETIEAAKNRDREAFNKALVNVNQTSNIINSVFSTMWYRSRPAAYNTYRTFIMGIKN